MVRIIVAAAVLGLASATYAFAGIPTQIPEPSLLMLMGSGIAGAILYVRNRRQQ